MINYIVGNVLDSRDDVLVHGCNCFNTMRSGVAALVTRYYPGASEADKQTFAGDETKIGTYSFWTGKNKNCDKDITVVNAYTQTTYGRSKTFVFADYDAIRNVMTEIRDDFKGKTICMPKIGAGLAGGDWSIIEKIINEVFGDIQVNVYVLEEVS